ncbi:unnamed protein product [Urochloa humidicola]
MWDDARLSCGLRDGQLGWDSRPPRLGLVLATLRAAGPRPSRHIRCTGPSAGNTAIPAWICALCSLASPATCTAGSGGGAGLGGTGRWVHVPQRPKWLGHSATTDEEDNACRLQRRARLRSPRSFFGSLRVVLTRI